MPGRSPHHPQQVLQQGTLSHSNAHKQRPPGTWCWRGPVSCAVLRLRAGATAAAQAAHARRFPCIDDDQAAPPALARGGACPMAVPAAADQCRCCAATSGCRMQPVSQRAMHVHRGADVSKRSLRTRSRHRQSRVRRSLQHACGQQRLYCSMRAARSKLLHLEELSHRCTA